MNPSATVIGIDYIDGLVKESIKNVRKAVREALYFISPKKTSCLKDFDLIESGRLKLLVGDGWEGSPDDAPFDAIHVGNLYQTKVLSIQLLSHLS